MLLEGHAEIQEFQEILAVSISLHLVEELIDLAFGFDYVSLGVEL